MITIATWFLWLITYSFIGWVYESIICSIDGKKLVNRGFLNGPFCPVYGFGAIIMILVLDQGTDNIFVLFFAGMLITSTVEYFTAFLLEKLFKAKWWDYSDYRFNFQGRIFLLGALVFGVMSVLLIKYIHPFIKDIYNQLPDWALISSSIVIFIVVAIDLYITVHYLFLLNDRLKEIQSALNNFLNKSLKRAEELKGTFFEKFEESEFYSEYIKKLFALNRHQGKRLARAFPKLNLQVANEAWKKLKKMLLNNNKNDKNDKKKP